MLAMYLFKLHMVLKSMYCIVSTQIYVSEVSQNQSNTIFLFFWLVDLSGVQREELFFRNTTIISKHPLVVRTLRPPTMCLDVSKETKTKKLHSHFRLMVFPKDNRDTFRILRGNKFGIPRIANFQYQDVLSRTEQKCLET